VKLLKAISPPVSHPPRVWGSC